MEITDVRIRRIDVEGKMKAVVSVTFDNDFVVHDIKIIESQNGLFIAMPSRKTPNGEFKDIAHPINSEMRERLQNAILEKYEMTTTADEKVKEVNEEAEKEEDEIAAE
jgi:stage V sporulation protein G